MPETLLRAAAVVLVIVFAAAAVAKLAHWREWRAALARYGLGGIEAIVAVAVPLSEVGLAVVLIAAPLRIVGAASLAVLAAFSAAIFLARSHQGDRLPCGCFGGARERDYRAMLGRNLVLMLVAALLVTAPARLRLTAGFAAPTRGELLGAALALTGIALGLWLIIQSAAVFRRTHS